LIRLSDLRQNRQADKLTVALGLPQLIGSVHIATCNSASLHYRLKVIFLLSTAACVFQVGAPKSSLAIYKSIRNILMQRMPTTFQERIAGPSGTE